MVRYRPHRPGAAGELDEPVPLHRRVPGNSLLGFLHMLVDPAQRAADPTMAVLARKVGGSTPALPLTAIKQAGMPFHGVRF